MSKRLTALVVACIGLCRDSHDLLQLGRDCFLTAKEQSYEAKTAQYGRDYPHFTAS